MSSSSVNLDFRKYDCPIKAIKDITSKQTTCPESFLVVDLEDLRRKHLNWLAKLPRVYPHYAVKCNPDPVVIRTLAHLGAGLDCASRSELVKGVEVCGVAPERIIFAHPCKPVESIEYAHSIGVDLLIFDNAIELRKMRKINPQAKCVLRIITNDDGAVWKLSSKFGADMNTSRQLIRLAGEIGADLVGVAFHVGSMQMRTEVFEESIRNARELFDYAKSECGIQMTLLDIGGGFPGGVDEEATKFFDKFTVEINQSLDRHFPVEYANQAPGFRIIAEPGNYYVYSGSTLASLVVAKRETELLGHLAEYTPNEAMVLKQAGETGKDRIDKSKAFMYYLTDGLYSAFIYMLTERIANPNLETYPIMIENAERRDLATCSLYKTSFWGPTCDGLDWITKEVYFPELFLDEYLIFTNLGSYGQSACYTPFNGMPMSRFVYIVNESWVDADLRSAFKEVELKED